MGDVEDEKEEYYTSKESVEEPVQQAERGTVISGVEAKQNLKESVRISEKTDDYRGTILEQDFKVIEQDKFSLINDEDE